MASTLVHLLHKSEDAEGIMVEVDFYYILPIVNKVINVESQLFMRKNPCVSLSGEQCAHFEYLLNNLWDRINAEEGECPVPASETGTDKIDGTDYLL